jgi:hypothetical protein
MDREMKQLRRGARREKRRLVPEAGPAYPGPPSSLTREVDAEAAKVYFDAAHEAARKARAALEKGDVEHGGALKQVAEGHLRTYREMKPDDLHLGGIR